MSDRARAFWIERPGQGRLRDLPRPAPAAGEVLIATRYSAISRGSESLVFRGEVPTSQYALMRAPFQEGEFPGPLKYGYCNVGEVLQGPDELRGRHVFCLYPHQDFYTVPAAAVRPLPAGLPPQRAVLAANLETAINATWDARPCVGDRIAVIGAGVVGCLVAALCASLPGTHVELIDIDPRRAEVAAQLGVAFRRPHDASQDADLLFHASGNPEGLALALRLGGHEARIVELSWYGDRVVPLPLGEHFHARRLTLRSSQVGTLPAHRLARWTHARRLDLALTLLCDPRFDALISGESPFEELPDVLARLASDPQGALCHRIRYSSS